MRNLLFAAVLAMLASSASATSITFYLNDQLGRGTGEGSVVYSDGSADETVLAEVEAHLGDLDASGDGFAANDSEGNFAFAFASRLFVAPDSFFNFSVDRSGPGTYAFVHDGIGLSYGSVTLDGPHPFPAPVPEPGIDALMLAGLAAVGAMRRRATLSSSRRPVTRQSWG